MQTMLVHLNVRQRRPGYLSAISAEVPGLHIVGTSPEDIRQRAMKAVKILLKANRKLDVLEVCCPRTICPSSRSRQPSVAT